MEILFARHKLLKCAQEKIDNLNSLKGNIYCREIELVVENFPTTTKKSQPKGLHWRILLNSLRKIQIETNSSIKQKNRDCIQTHFRRLALP